jgi:diacylglycerol kinase (ATP)
MGRKTRRKNNSYALVINPVAKSGKSKKALPKIKRFFEKRNLKLDVLETKCKGDAINLAKSASKNHDVVIAGGGDGTINEVINGIAGSKAVLGIIPMGTANVLSVELNIPTDITKACRFMIENEAIDIDIGRINGRYFLSWAGVGLDSKLIKDAEEVPLLKTIFGQLSYYISALRTLITYSPTKTSIKVDGKDYVGYFVLIGNISYYAGKYKVLPKARVNDGKLDILIYKNKNLIHNFKYSIAMGIGQHVNFEDIEYLQGEKITIDSYDEALVHADAELVSKTPAKIEVMCNFLKVIC